MILRMAILFERKTVNYDGRDRNVYKAYDIDVGGYGENPMGQWLFCGLSRDYTIMAINKENILKFGDSFNNYSSFAGMISEDDFIYKYRVNGDYNYKLSKKNKLMEWNGYYSLFKDGSLSKIYDEKFIEEIKKVFGEDHKDRTIEKRDDFKSVLKKYGTFLTDKEYKFNPAIGREEEIKRLEMSLLGYDTCGMLVGDAGVGKTAIVEGLAYKIKNGLVHEKLKGIEIVSISSTGMISGARYVGDKEERLLEIINILKNNKNIIMFTDEIHTLVGAGQGNKSNLDVANILKPYIDRGDIKIVGSTTEEEYEKLMSDSAFKSRFKKIKVNEPDRNTLIKILDGVIEGLEKVYDIKFDFSDIMKSKIYNILVELTIDKNREYNDKTNNPRLVLSIIKDMFSSALYNNHKSIIIDDIIFAIYECDRIYNSVKDRYIFELKKHLVTNRENADHIKVLKLYQD